MDCDICGRGMEPRVSQWTFYCAACDHWQSNLGIKLEDSRIHGLEHVEEKDDSLDFLWPVREGNFKIILDAIRRHSERHSRILDIGSATGQFLSQAQAAGFEVLGIEPNERFVSNSLKRGLPVVHGLFPDAIPADSKFDVIVFNDVLEHIPGAKSIVEECLQHLTPGGIIVINAPFSEGVFFNLGKLKIASQMWDRLWQKHFYTPHVHYYSQKSIAKLAASVGCSATPPRRLATLARKGTWARINLDPAISTPKKIAIWGAVTAALPVISMLPADARFSILEKQVV